FQAFGISQQLRRIAVRVARISAGADLDRFHAELHQVVERFLERLVAKQHRKDADLHTVTHLRFEDAVSIAWRTRWFARPSAKFGVGILSSATASSRSNTVCVNVCS